MASAAAELVQAAPGSTDQRIRSRIPKLHPEHLPPPEVMVQWPARLPAYIDICAQEATQGNPDPLIGYLRSGGDALTPAAVDVIIEALEAKRGKRYISKCCTTLSSF